MRIFYLTSPSCLRRPVGTTRYEVPHPIGGTLPSKPTNTLYEVFFNQDVNGFHFKVVRKSTGTTVFDTSLPGFIFADQFIQISTRLPSENVYGLGENEQHSYRHDLNWKRWVGYARWFGKSNIVRFSFLFSNRTLFWCRDQPPYGTNNMYGVHPTYTVLENDGNAHSVLFLNSNAQEWSFTPSPAFTYRTIGGLLDIYIFMGPTPSKEYTSDKCIKAFWVTVFIYQGDTNAQYTAAIGRYPMPPYWSLGFHLCRYGYNTLENMQAAVDRTAEYNIPHDAQWGDIDVMDHELDFTINPVEFAGYTKSHVVHILF